MLLNLSIITDYKKLFHEIPLLVIKRSILLENEALFQNLIRVYKTRNMIVHCAGPLDETETERISLNEKGANEAFNIALDTFKWLKIEKFEILRNRKHILIE